MKESKLKSIAKDLYQDVKHSETPSDVYVNVMEIVTQQKDYFIDCNTGNGELRPTFL